MSIDQPSHAGIDALYTAWRDAFRRRDVEGVLAMLSADYRLWGPGLPAMGRDDLRPRLAAAFATYDIVPEYACEERLVSGDLAFERGWDTQRIRPRAGGDEQVQRQRVFLVLRREEDGMWRFARGMSQPGPAT